MKNAASYFRSFEVYPLTGEQSVNEVADHFDRSKFISTKEVFEIIYTCFHMLDSTHRSDARNIVAEGLRAWARSLNLDKDVKNQVELGALAAVTLKNSETTGFEARIVFDIEPRYGTEVTTQKTGKKTSNTGGLFIASCLNTLNVKHYSEFFSASPYH